MSSIENARKELQISGYVHPTTTKSVNKNAYKTFNTESKDDYRSSSSKPSYATFTDKDTTVKQLNDCPYCGGVAMYICDCVLKDKQCSKGHVWYINKSGHIKKGDPHEND